MTVSLYFIYRQLCGGNEVGKCGFYVSCFFENFTSGRVNDVEGFEKKEDTLISLLEKAENLIYNEDEKLREIFNMLATKGI